MTGHTCMPEQVVARFAIVLSLFRAREARSASTEIQRAARVLTGIPNTTIKRRGKPERVEYFCSVGTCTTDRRHIWAEWHYAEELPLVLLSSSMKTVEPHSNRK